MSKEFHLARGGWLVDEYGDTVNIVDILGGGFPTSDKSHDVNTFKPKTILIVGQDGREYNLAELLKNVSSGGSGGGSIGFNGWTPLPSIVADGERRVLQISDWMGGGGAKPPTGQYIGATGLTDYVNLAIDIRGTIGSPGTNGNDATINGVNALEIVDGENTTVEIDGNQLKINANSEITEMLTIKRI